MYHQRTRFGGLKKPSEAYANFRAARLMGVLHPTAKWEDVNEAYRKRLRKRKAARLSRRRNRTQ